MKERGKIDIGEPDPLNKGFFETLRAEMESSREYVLLSDFEKLALARYPRASAQLLRLNLLGTADNVQLACAYSLYLSARQTISHSHRVQEANSFLDSAAPGMNLVSRDSLSSAKNSCRPAAIAMQSFATESEEILARCVSFIEPRGWKLVECDGEFVETASHNRPQQLYTYLVRTIYQRVWDGMESVIAQFEPPSTDRRANALKLAVSFALRELFAFPEAGWNPEARSKLSRTIENFRSSVGPKGRLETKRKALR